RILFVDDDELILRSIERVLRAPAESAHWDIQFASDGDSALRKLEEQPLDVIFVDANMPRMNGTTLLRRVQELRPGAVRILFSGQTGFDGLRAALPYAHQFIPKPCDVQVLKSTLENACGIREVLERPEMRQLVASSNELPSAPRTYIELTSALGNPKTSARTVADIVEKDIAISARVLQLAR